MTIKLVSTAVVGIRILGQIGLVSSFCINTHQCNVKKGVGTCTVTSTSMVTGTSMVTDTGNSSGSSSGNSSRSSSSLQMSEWGDFAALEDDDDDDVDGGSFADENDSQEYKAQIGSAVEGPELSWFGEPIFLPQGSVLPLTEENVQGVLAACREEIGTMFGYTAENRGVGITGGVDFIDFDGPAVIVHLKGRFWHQRPTVLDRVEKYIQGRIPEVIEVIVEDPWELTDECNNEAL